MKDIKYDFVLEDIKNNMRDFFKESDLKKYVTKRYFEKYCNLDYIMFYINNLIETFSFQYAKELKFDFFFTKKEDRITFEIIFIGVGNLKREDIPDDEEWRQLKDRVDTIQNQLLEQIKQLLLNVLRLSANSVNKLFLETIKDNPEATEDLEKLDNSLLFQELDFLFLPVSKGLLYEKNVRNKL